MLVRGVKLAVKRVFPRDRGLHRYPKHSVHTHWAQPLRAACGRLPVPVPRGSSARRKWRT